MCPICTCIFLTTISRHTHTHTHTHTPRILNGWSKCINAGRFLLACEKKKKKKSILCLLYFFAAVLAVVLCCVFLLLSMGTLGMYYHRSIPLGLAVSDNEQRAASAISS